MDNLGSNSPQSGNDLDKPIPFDDSDKPTGGPGGVSRAPLNLGGGGAAPAPKPRAAAPVAKAQAPRPPQASRPAQAPRPAQAAPSVASMVGAGNRITGCKTFFTKLHAGAIEFLDGQITNWLQENTDIVIKSTNISVGEVAAKKTEPNILVVVWY